MSAEIEIVRLKPDEWEKLKELRLRALQEEPTAYSSSYESALERPEKIWRDALQNDWYFFAELKGELVGMVGARRESEDKNRHIANVFGVYVASEARGMGIGKRLMERLLQELQDDESIVKVELFVTALQTTAQKMYESLGFERVGLLEKEVFVGGEYLDEYLMQKFLRTV